MLNGPAEPWATRPKLPEAMPRETVVPHGRCAPRCRRPHPRWRLIVWSNRTTCLHAAWHECLQRRHSSSLSCDTPHDNAPHAPRTAPRDGPSWKQLGPGPGWAVGRPPSLYCVVSYRIVLYYSISFGWMDLPRAVLTLTQGSPTGASARVRVRPEGRRSRGRRHRHGSVGSNAAVPRATDWKMTESLLLICLYVYVVVIDWMCFRKMPESAPTAVWTCARAPARPA